MRENVSSPRFNKALLSNDLQYFSVEGRITSLKNLQNFREIGPELGLLDSLWLFSS